MLARHFGQRGVAFGGRARPVRLVPVRAEQLLERIARLQRDAQAEGSLNARVGPTQVVRSRNTHEFSVRQVPKAALGYEAPRARASVSPATPQNTQFSEADTPSGSP